MSWPVGLPLGTVNFGKAVVMQSGVELPMRVTVDIVLSATAPSKVLVYRPTGSPLPGVTTLFTSDEGTNVHSMSLPLCDSDDMGYGDGSLIALDEDHPYTHIYKVKIEYLSPDLTTVYSALTTTKNFILTGENDTGDIDDLVLIPGSAASVGLPIQIPDSWSTMIAEAQAASSAEVVYSATGADVVVPPLTTMTKITLTANCLVHLPTDLAAEGHSIIHQFIQDDVGGWTVTFDPEPEWLGDGEQPDIDLTPEERTFIGTFTMEHGDAWQGVGTVEDILTLTAHHATHEPGGTDPLDMSTMYRRGTYALRPAATSLLQGLNYYAHDDRGGTLYRARSTQWDQVGHSRRRRLAPRGYTRFNIDRTGAALTGPVTITTGRLHLMAIEVEEGDLISNLIVFTGNTAGASLTHRWMVLFDEAMTSRLAESADNVTTSMNSNEPHPFAMTTPYAVTAPGFLYAGIMIAGTTLPTLLSLASNNGMMGLDPELCYTANTGLTTPASLTGTPTPLASQGTVPVVAFS